MTPKVGHYLYATCAGADYGRVLRVGRDANGCPVVDIEVYELDAIAGANESGMDGEPGSFGFSALTSLRVLPSDAKVILVDVQYKPTERGIECNTPGDGCHRCEKCFWLKDEPAALTQFERSRDASRGYRCAARDALEPANLTEIPGVYVDIALKLPVDPDAPPDSLTLEAFTLGMWAAISANDPLGFGAGPAPEDIEFSWDAWLALSSEERQDLRREAWRLLRQVPGMPLVPTRAIGKPLPGFEAPEP